MSIIKVENLSFSYPTSDELIFDNVSFSVDTDWRLGFVGRNGRGKTTFLNLLMGKYEYRGKIRSSVGFDYFPYEVRDKGADTEAVLREVAPTAEDWQFMRELAYLDVNAEVLYRPFRTLSNGEQTKVLLAALFLNEGKFLLIDEPTNHLDTAARGLVAQYLKRKKGFILVSHDRNFLDGCVDHILSLNKSNIEVVSGNFSSFMADFERRQDYERKEALRLQTDIRRLNEAARRTAQWSDKVEASKIGTRVGGLRPDRGFIGHKSAKMMKRAKVVEARQQKEIEQKSKLLQNVEYTHKLKLLPLDYRAETLAVFNGVAAVYGGREVMLPTSFCVKRGDRIAIDGKNGSGKSSLLKLLCGQNIEHSGDIKIGSNLIISYVPQDSSFLRGTLKDLAAESNIDESLFKSMLQKLGMDKAQFGKDMSEFSGGQKKKTLIAKSLCESAHLYVWDEPLNYIDVFSRIQIEELITAFNPTMIFVEHDKAFQNEIATSVVEIKNLLL
ncbi:MAG: ABC-F type ribosomal protection protein [Clostridiales bacterium]|nr:ABC-F type ribosomal protection protein [Clostridiales bacterium]